MNNEQRTEKPQQLPAMTAEQVGSGVSVVGWERNGGFPPLQQVAEYIVARNCVTDIKSPLGGME